MNITIPLQSRAKEPLYEQMIRYLRHAIEQGELAPGEKLPSKRGLAAHLQVSVSTVETAYAQLVAEGYLTVRDRSGFFVERLIPDGYSRYDIPVRPTSADDDYESRSAANEKQAQGHTVAPARHENIPTARRAADDDRTWSDPCVPSMEEDRVKFDFSSSRVDAGRFPFSTWAKLLRQVLCEDSRRLLDPGPPQGMLELRAAIARQLRANRGLAVSPEQIVVGAGSETLMSLLVQLLGHSRMYGVETPGYPKLYQILKSHGVPTRLIPMEADSISVHQLERQGVSVAHVTPSHHFPLGTAMPISRRMELLAWAVRESDRVILEDDYDSELRYEGRPSPPLALLDRGERVIYLGSFAKSLAPSFRIGYLVLPPTLAERYRNRLSFLACTLPVIEQLTLARFLSGGYYERHLNRIRKCYRARRDALSDALAASPLAGRLSLSGGEAGTHLLLTLQGLSEREMIERARRREVRISGLSEYGGEPEPHAATVLLGFAGMDEETLRQGAQRLISAWLDAPGDFCQ